MVCLFGCGLLALVVVGSGWLGLAAVGCAWLWLAVADFGRLKLAGVTDCCLLQRTINKSVDLHVQPFELAFFDASQIDRGYHPFSLN